MLKKNSKFAGGKLNKKLIDSTLNQRRSLNKLAQLYQLTKSKVKTHFSKYYPMKHCIIRALNWFLNKLQHQNKVECTDSNENTSNVLDQFDLAPSIIPQKEKGETNKTYQTVLDLAAKLSNPHVSNIALTGPFGSGKSSILKTLKHDFSEYNYLDISLATLEANKEIPEIEDKEIVNPNEKEPLKPQANADKKEDSKKSKQLDKEASLNRLIEYSILQQLIYKERIQDIPESRFKRIKHIDKCKSFIYSILCVIFIAAICIVFEPKFLYNQFLYNLLAVGPTAKTVWDIIALFYIAVYGSCIIRWLITNLYNSRLNKINLKDGEIDLAENTSIFNKHLDEIIYFFEVTNYNVVIIEDLDRFATHHIFLKLRELNQLLNNSKAINPNGTRKITFIYAVKDDIFKDSSRTKFFDYIVTVIPVINPSNSCEKLRKSLHKIIPETDTDISDQVCKELGLYIDDMRLLLNIVNEYKQYRHRLADQLEQKKLLAMIIYKNYYPKDFASLHNQKGIVYKVVSNKEKYIKSSIASKEKQRDTLKEELVRIQTQYQAFSQEELRKCYIFHYAKHCPSISAFSESSNSSRHSLAEVAKDTNLFTKLMNNEFVYYWTDNWSNQRVSPKFQTIENEVDPNYTYQQRISLVPKRVDEINTDIKKLELSIIETKSQSLGQILQQYSAEAFYHEVEDSHLITFLLQNGYIDEDYYDYISYFYPGTMTSSDKAFVLDVNCGRKKEYNYQIHKPVAVIEQLLDVSFSSGTMLNIHLVDFIVNKKEEYESHYQRIIKQIIKAKEFRFIESYYSQIPDPSVFFNELLPVWKSFVNDGIYKEADAVYADLHFEILLKYFPQAEIKNYNNIQFIKYIANRFDYLSIIPDDRIFANTQFISKQFHVKYKTLKLSDLITKEFWKFIIDGDHYEISDNNIFCILSAIWPRIADMYKTSSYTAIIQSEYDPVINYVDTDLDHCVTSIFPESSTNEQPEIIIKLINNPNIQEESKLYYLSKQMNKVNEITAIEQTYWDLALKCNIVSPTWNNIASYPFPKDVIMKISVELIKFIELNNEILATQSARDYISEEHEEFFFALLMNTNQLSLQAYKNIRKAFDRSFRDTDFTTLEEERIQHLIETRGIDFNLYNYNLIEINYEKQTLPFILTNKNEYFDLINEINLKPDIASKLLQDVSLKLCEQLSIINSLQVEIVDQQPQLATIICEIVSAQQEIAISNEFVIALLKNSTNHEYKLALFTQKCITSTYDEEFVIDGLTQLGGDYAKIALQKGKRPKIEKNKYNQLLAEFLKAKDFISQQKDEDGMIRIISRCTE